jgi:predicted ATPase/DNA-binding SARP family transcriptional activator
VVLAKVAEVSAPSTQQSAGVGLSPLVGMRVAMLGEFSVEVAGRRIEASHWKHRHPKLLLQMLCLAPGHLLSRDEATGALWPRAGVRASANRLYHTLHRLRGILVATGIDEATARQAAQLQAGVVALRCALDVDAARLRAAVHAARKSGDVAALDGIEPLLSQPLVVDAADGEWFVPHRDELLRDQAWALEQQASRHQAEGRLDSAVACMRAWVAIEPGSESAHRRLIELYARQGRADLAAQQFVACRRFLQRDRGVEPSAALRDAADRAAAGATPAPPAASADATAAPASPDRFAPPHYAHPLLGRDHDLVTLRAWIAGGQSRLVTLCAGGGLGKTRLAAALTDALRGEFADGARFIALAAVQRPSKLADLVCEALGVDAAGQDAEQLLPQQLAQRHILLVLDRFEHLVDAAAQVARWVQAAPRLTIIVTSQLALKTRAERVYELPPMGLAVPDAPAELFVRSARARGIEIDLQTDGDLVRRVCNQLEGHPLAIELAAVQLSETRLQDMPAALSERAMQLLAGAAPDGDPRHSSLQRTIGWSYSLLAADESDVLKACAAFAGDFSAEDLQATMGDRFVHATSAQALRTLIERHLLLRRSDAAGASAGRFAMADSVRAFAEEAARTDGSWSTLRTAHASHFAQAAARISQLVRNGQGGTGYVPYLAAAEDIDKALGWLRSHAPAETYLQTCRDAGLLTLNYGSTRSGVDLLLSARDVPATTQAEQCQSASCHYLAARGLSEIGQAEQSMRALRRARALARRGSDRRLLGAISTHMTELLMSQLRMPEAQAEIEAAVSDSLSRSDTTYLPAQYNVLANCLEMFGDYDRSLGAARQALDWALKLQLPTATVWALISACLGDTARGRIAAAEVALADAWRMLPSGFSVWTNLYLHLTAFQLAHERGRHDEPLGQEQALSQCGPGMTRMAQLFELGRVFVLMEQEQFDEAAQLPVMLTEIRFEADFCAMHAHAAAYRLQLHAHCGDGIRARASLRALNSLLGATRNPLWAAWAADAGARAAHVWQQPSLAQELLELSRRLLALRNLTPTPRQLASWARAEALLAQPTARCSAVNPDLIEALRALRDRFESWTSG